MFLFHNATAREVLGLNAPRFIIEKRLKVQQVLFFGVGRMHAIFSTLKFLY